MDVSLDDAAALWALLGDFLQVAVHTILYYRRLYPERAFLSATAFGVAVHQNRHPQVCAWIQDAVDQVLRQVAGGGVESVAVVVHAPFTTQATPAVIPPGAVLERWMFDVRQLPAWPGGAAAWEQHRAKPDGSGPAEPSEQQRPRTSTSTRTSTRTSTNLAQRKRASRQANSASPQKRPRLEAGDGNDNDDDDDGDDNDDDDNDDGRPRYDYYDEEEELANAESEAELDEPDDEPDPPEPPDETTTIPWADLHHQLRAVVQRLGHAAAQLAPLPPQCTFTVALTLADASDEAAAAAAPARVGDDVRWIPAAARRETKAKQAGMTTTTTTTTTTIRSVDAAPLFMECWVEESAIKHYSNTQSKGKSVSFGDI